MFFELKKSKVFLLNLLFITGISTVFAQDNGIDDSTALTAAKASKLICESANGYLVVNNPSADTALIDRINRGRKKAYQSIVDSKTTLIQVEQQAGSKLHAAADTNGGCKSDKIVPSDAF